MLNCLRVHDFAIIDHLEVELGPGLNVVTGETGAGKSILVAALNLVLGGKGSGDLVRTGKKHAEVEALFELPDSAHTTLCSQLEDAGVELGDELVIRRRVFPTGRTRAYINGSLATAEQLKTLAEGLADISSQHEHHSLINAKKHLDFLDAFGSLGTLRDEVAMRFACFSDANRALSEYNSLLKARSDREDLLRFQLHELSELNPEIGEVAELEQERARLRHATRLMEVADGSEKALYADDGALSEKLARVTTEVLEASKLDTQLTPVANQLAEALTLIEDAANELASYAQKLDGDPTRLEEVEMRLSHYARLFRKYGTTEAELLKHAEQARTDLELFEDTEHKRSTLERDVDAKKKQVAKVARELSKARKTHAQTLADAISDELQTLGMGGARVEVSLRAQQGADDALMVDGARLSSTGIDHAEFLIAPNKGEAARPLAKVASGGELSRALLAIKRVLAGLRPSGLYVFDEVDTGVGGAVAEVIGGKLKEVAAHHQVLCITHLAQIAAHGDQHFQVEKGVVGERTTSRIERLDDEARINEIARMVGGVTLTKTTRAMAQEMLELAKKPKAPNEPRLKYFNTPTEKSSDTSEKRVPSKRKKRSNAKRDKRPNKVEQVRASA